MSPGRSSVPVQIRPATPDDAPAVGALALALYALHHGWDPLRFMDLGAAGVSSERRDRFFRSLARAPRTALLVAERDGGIIGYAYATLDDPDYMRLLDACAWLQDVYVEPGHRGTGAGRALFDAVREWATAAGAPRLVLEVAEKNAHAREFFARSGARDTMREMTLELGGD